MKVLVIGILLSLAAWGWLVISASMGESPMHFVGGQSLFDPGGNLNFALYHAFVPIAHGTLGAGLALVVVRRRSADV